MLSYLDVLCGALGVAGGFFYVMAGYGEATKSQAYFDAPRVKNFARMLSGGVVTFIADWNSVVPGTDRLRLTAFYEVCAIVSTFGFIAAVCVAIIIHIHFQNRGAPRVAHISTIPVLLEFLAGGFPGYRSALQAAKETVERNKANLVDVVPDLMRMIAALLSAMINHSSKDAAAKVAAAPDFIDRTLDAMSPSLLLQCRQGQGKNMSVNYMRAVRIADTDERQRNAAYFVDHASLHQTCTHLLVLEHYQGGRALPHFALPVHREIGSCLPGAPLVFRDGVPRAMCTRRVKFEGRSKIPKQAQQDIIKYFHGRRFRSFLCVPIVKGEAIIGVVNVESDDEVFDPRDDDFVVRLGNSLQPYCTILGYLLE